MNVVLVDLGAVPAAAAAHVAVPTQSGGVEPPPGEPEFGKASPVALVVILLLGVATLLLIRSMTKHLKKVPASFDPPESESGPTDGETAGPRQP